MTSLNLLRGLVVGLMVVNVTPVPTAAASELDRAEQHDEAVRKLIEKLASDNDYERSCAAAELAELGPAALPAVPALIQTLKSRVPLRSPLSGGTKTYTDPSPKVAREALVRIGAVAAPLLEKALKNDDSLTRVHAAWALWSITRETKNALPVLLREWRDPTNDRQDLCIRYAATSALGEISKVEADLLLPIVLKALADDAQMGYSVTCVLTSMGETDKRGVEHLYKLLSTPGYDLYRFAAFGLRELKPAAVPLLIDGLRSENAELRARAAWTLAGMKSSYAASAIPQLRHCLRDSSDDVRRWAAWALDRIEEQTFDRYYD